jgi:tetratricopeptide (TPR) repeat protein
MGCVRIVRRVLLGLCLLTCPVLAHVGTDERLRRLGEQLANSPGDASLYIQRGEVHRDNRHWQLSWQDYQSALSKAEGADLRLEVLFCMGRMKLQSGQPDEALVLLRQVTGKNPEFKLAHLNIARTYMALGNPELAVVEMDRFLGLLEAPVPDYYLERARMAMGAGPAGIELAIAGLEGAIEQLGPLVVLVQALSDAYRQNKNWQQALEIIAELPPELRQLPVWLARVGDIYHGSHNPVAARQAYEDALAAIAALPASRQATRAIHDLKTELCQKVDSC